MKHIASRDNPFFKDLVRLANASRAVREGRVLLDGVHLVKTYLERFGRDQVHLIVKESAALHPEITGLVTGVDATYLADRLFDQVAPVRSPVGVLAVAPIPSHQGEPEVAGFRVLVDRVQDPGNLGSILRSAAAAGASAAHLSRDCADPWSPKSLRGGMGAQLLLRVDEQASLADFAGSLKMPVIACAQNAADSLFETNLRGPMAFIVGAEGTGITRALLARADRVVKIPMCSGLESLNVGAAAAVCFYEWRRQQG